MITTIPLSKLVSSPRNVRRHSDAQADAELKADIEARGLLQNLVVTGVRKPKGCYAVEAGERRRRALQSLADEGKLSPDVDVCCLVVRGGVAGREASLAENFQRLSMNPADECLAFGQLIEQGADVEGIARRFGLTIRFVEGRLRLAGLAPVVFDALGAGEISLDIAKAYAATPDRERQAWVYEQLGRGYSAHHPDSIRRMMTQATASAADRRARLVGEDAYLAAGGRIERDLFADEAAVRWLDIPLLERLACEKMAALADEVAAESGLAFVRPTLDSWVGYDQLDGLRRVPLDPPPLTDEESAELDALEDEIGTLAELLEGEETGDDQREPAETRIRAINARIEALTDRRPVLDDALKGEVGAFLVLDERGQARLDTTYYREVGTEEPATELPEPTSADSPARAKKPAGLSHRLEGELAMQRRDILALHVAGDPVLALDLAIFLMADRDGDYSGGKAGSSLLAIPPTNPVFDFKPVDAAATVAREQAREALDRSWMEGATRAARFDAFRALPLEARMAWLGQTVAGTLEASLNSPGDRACAFHDHLGQLLAIEVARWWRPTGTNYFDRVPKAVALAALEEVGGTGLAQRYAKHKKAELSEACERIFAGDFIAEIDVKQAALAWLPAVMRFAELSQPAAVGELEPPVDAGDTGEGQGESEGPHDHAPDAVEEGAPSEVPAVDEAA
ncbi:MAG: hypothetical protein B7Z08_01045 [Sphingomonadales bacterium 32-68-7]|nr:MAG: hypothetical protein B7Z33_03280 [Sphingomonadales bacterium 12-68-11]OYX10428.1 MAG: hypothetical protein B7Z08_01045 [Sphingomonadales bacterium 32-68-7]